MGAGYSSVKKEADGVWDQRSAEARAALEAVGAVLTDGFFSNGVPEIRLSDMTKAKGEAFDLEPFKGRIILGGALVGGGGNPFPQNPDKLCIVRWGEGPDEIGCIRVGKSSLSGTSIVSYVGVTIGDGVLFGPSVVIMDSDGHPSDRRLPDCAATKAKAPVVIEDHAWIGLGATIMKGVTIGHHAVVATRALVVKDVPPHCVVGGNPAKIIKDYRETE